MIKTTIIKNLTTAIYLHEGMEILLAQVGVAEIDVEFCEGKIKAVTAPNGIVFAKDMLNLALPDNWDMTDMCDLKRLKKQIEIEDEERAEFRTSRYRWDSEFRIGQAA